MRTRREAASQAWQGMPRLPRSARSAAGVMAATAAHSEHTSWLMLPCISTVAPVAARPARSAAAGQSHGAPTAAHRERKRCLVLSGARSAVHEALRIEMLRELAGLGQGPEERTGQATSRQLRAAHDEQLATVLLSPNNDAQADASGQIQGHRLRPPLARARRRAAHRRGCRSGARWPGQRLPPGRRC